MPKVVNPGPSTHRVRSHWFPVGEPVECDEATAKWVIENMGFKAVAQAIAEGPVASKPVKPVKK